MQKKRCKKEYLSSNPSFRNQEGDQLCNTKKNPTNKWQSRKPCNSGSELPTIQPTWCREKDPNICPWNNSNKILPKWKYQCICLKILEPKFDIDPRNVIKKFKILVQPWPKKCDQVIKTLVQVNTVQNEQQQPQQLSGLDRKNVSKFCSPNYMYVHFIHCTIVLILFAVITHDNHNGNLTAWVSPIILM